MRNSRPRAFLGMTIWNCGVTESAMSAASACGENDARASAVIRSDVPVSVRNRFSTGDGGISQKGDGIG